MRKGAQTAKVKGKGGKVEATGFGFQGVELNGGGIGGTGSARIAGLKTVALPAAETIEEELKPPPNLTPSKKTKGKKRK